MKRPSEVPPPVDSSGRTPVTASTAAVTPLTRRPDRRQEWLAGEVPAQLVLEAVALQECLDVRLQPLVGPHRGVADVETRL